MNPFVVSARKYRPATFNTVVGQEHITSTLKNAIRTNHLAQAFLFCGPRGVGKTTCARILAKTLNCKQLTPDFEACNTCDSCLSFNNGQSLNIYELDAASNNSVDDIRSLVEQVRYAPHSGEYKIYIIDEVHMLSPSAFNAFLKTLEEPPSYAVFILATTEKHKIIPTILSRCQIFDFNRIQMEDIANHLAFVAKGEGVHAEEEALHIIAQKADGALRDALSIFDQIVSFAGTNLTYKDVISNLSILDYDYYFKLTDQIRNGNIPQVLVTFNELLADGFDGHHFISGLASHFRDLLVSKDELTLPLLEVSKGTREKYKTQAAIIDQLHLLKYLNICSKCDIDFRSARNQRLHVELALIRLCSVGGSVTIESGFDAGTEKKSPLNITNVGTVVKSDITIKTTPVARSEKEVVLESNETAAVPIAGSATQSPAKVKPQEVSPAESTYRSTGLLQGTSLSSLKKVQVEVAQVNIPQVKVNEKTEIFDKNQLQLIWKEYADKVNADGKLQLNATLTMNEPVLKDGFEIELILNNQAQEDLLRDEKSELIHFLRERLNNGLINVITRKEMKSDDPENAYTNKEKYIKMVEKNQGLDDFRKQLGLELEL
ncbi:MAG: DNA polymerase III subunit gamma/tau [Bacteroidetes bacterium]|nr:DNA polymerase III subunit gamma/tau [Bacteroidota bacterium]